MLNLRNLLLHHKTDAYVGSLEEKSNLLSQKILLFQTAMKRVSVNSYTRFSKRFYMFILTTATPVCSIQESNTNTSTPNVNVKNQIPKRNLLPQLLSDDITTQNPNGYINIRKHTSPRYKHTGNSSTFTKQT